jgi:crotonobetainyl-CoA:carnitine CoA-transferase CaiB-like acyl-CoA transferase
MQMKELAEPRFATVLGRLSERETINRIVEEWTQEWDHNELMHYLQSQGIAAQAVLDIAEVVQDPHFNDRQFVQRIVHPETGTHLGLRAPWKVTDVPADIRLPAPCFGEHNERVLGGLLGLSSAELHRLEDSGVIGNNPAS